MAQNMVRKPLKKPFAVVELGGAQELVCLGDKLEIHHLDVEKGKLFSTDKVLLFADGDEIKVGTPYVKGLIVAFKVLEHKKGEKIKVIRFKAKSRYRRTRGHRQQLSVLEVTKLGSAQKVSKEKKSPVKKVQRKKAPPAKTKEKKK